MKSVLATVILAFGLAAGVPIVGQGQPDKALQDAAEARTKSMQSGDAAGWGKYTTDDFVVIQANGVVKSKQQRLAEIKATPTAASDMTEQKWRTYGSTTAISTARATIDGKPTRITTVWVKQPDGWQVASVQLTNIASTE
jgi:ketosteroid isomerase-like protein